METNISTEGILSIKALTMTKKVFEQVENRPPKRDGVVTEWGTMKPTVGLIGFVRDPSHLQMVFFIGKDEDKLWKVRQDDLEEWLVGAGMTYPVAHKTRAEFMGKLPQIFLK